MLVRPPQTSMLLKDFFTLLDRSRGKGVCASATGKGGPVPGKEEGKDKPVQVTESFYIEYLALHQYLGKVYSILSNYAYICMHTVVLVLYDAYVYLMYVPSMYIGIPRSYSSTTLYTTSFPP